MGFDAEKAVREAVSNNRLEGLDCDAEALVMARKAVAGEISEEQLEAWKSERIEKIRAEMEPGMRQFG